MECRKEKNAQMEEIASSFLKGGEIPSEKSGENESRRCAHPLCAWSSAYGEKKKSIRLRSLQKKKVPTPQAKGGEKRVISTQKKNKGRGKGERLDLEIGGGSMMNCFGILGQKGGRDDTGEKVLRRKKRNEEVRRNFLAGISSSRFGGK